MAGDAFEKMKSSLNRGVTAISLKTSSSLEKAKLRTHMDSLGTEIERLTVSVGKAAYAIWESGGSDYASLEEQCSAIRQKKEEIESLKAEYNAIDEKGNQIMGTASAGENTLSEDKTEETVCPGCGASCSASARFCRKCGHKLREDS